MFFCVTLERAKELADKVGGQAMTLEEIEHFHPEDGMVLANTTSVGMKPKIDDTPLPKHALKHYCVVFDAIYTPKDTKLLREARETGAIIVYGTEMLIRQGFEQYRNFTGLPGTYKLKFLRSVYTLESLLIMDVCNFLLYSQHLKNYSGH